MFRPEQTELERLRYWQGQMLRSRDFRDQTNIEAQMRYWHNRALHNAYGVSFGLEASAVPDPKDHPNSPLIAVRVTCGLAYDCFGRELVLPSTRQIRIAPAPRKDSRPRNPEQPRALILAVRYRKTAAGCCSSTNELAAVCWPASCNGAPDELEFYWTRTDCSEVVEGVPLARVTYDADGKPHLDDQPVEPKARFVAPRARALSRPHIADGLTIPDNTAWESWEVNVAGSKKGGVVPFEIGVQTRVETSAAGFTETPVYLAWLESSDRQPSQRLFFSSIVEPSISEFTFRLLMPPLAGPRYGAKRVPGATIPLLAARTPSHLNSAMIQLGEASALAPGSQIEVLIDARPGFAAMVESIGPNNSAQISFGAEAGDLTEDMTIVLVLNRTNNGLVNLAQRSKLYVCWVGCQPERAVQMECPERTDIQTLCD